MTDPYTDQAKALAALSAENGLLRAEIELLRDALQGALSMVDSFAFGAGLSTAGRAEYESYRRAVEPKP